MLRFSRLSLTAIALLPALACAQDTQVRELITGLTTAKTAHKARRALTELGAPGILALVEELQRMPTSELSLPRRRAALEFLASNPRAAANSVPQLLEALRATSDPDHLHAYFLALQEIGPYSRDKASIREVATSRVPMLLRSEDGEWVAHTSDMKIVAGLRTLARLNIDPDGTIDSLVYELGDKNPLRREYAAILLGRRNSAARSALSELRIAFDADQPSHISGPGFQFNIDSTDLVQRAIAIAISRIDPAHPDAVTGLMLRLKSSTASDRVTAALALGQLGKSARAVDALMLSALDSDPRIAAESITALGMLGPKARRATGLLQRFIRGTEKELKQRAKAALKRILTVEPIEHK